MLFTIHITHIFKEQQQEDVWTVKEGIEIGWRIEGTLFSPGSKKYSYIPGVKKQLKIKKYYRNGA